MLCYTKYNSVNQKRETMQTDVINAFLKDQFGSEWELQNDVCHMDNEGEYFATLAYNEPNIRITFIYEFRHREISSDMAMSLLLLNAHPEMIGRGSFSVTDNGAILLSFYTENRFFTIPELQEFWKNCLMWREGYFDFLDKNYKNNNINN